MLEKGNYEKAFKKALHQMENQKSDKSTRQVLKLALGEIVEEKMAKYEQFEKGTSPKEWDKAIKIGDDIKTKIGQASAYLEQPHTETYQRLVSEKETLHERSYAYYEALGYDYLQQFADTELKAHAQDACLSFEKAKRYIPSRTALDSLIDYTEENGIYYYTVSADASFEILSNWVINQRFDDVEGYSSRFRKISYNNFGNGDCHIDVDFGLLSDRIREIRSTNNYSQQIQDGYETQTDTSGLVTQVPIYITIEGQVEEIQETMEMDWTASVSIRSYSNSCNLFGTSFSARASQTIQRYELSGDERAIPAQYKTIGFDPKFDEDDMKEELIDDIYNQFVSSYF